MKILITGGTSGLGYALSCALSKKGHIVYVASKTEKEKNTLTEKIKQERMILFPIVLDLLKEEDRNEVKNLDIDVLVLQAGIGEGGNLLSLDIQKMRENYEVNVFGNLALLQTYIKTCDEQKKHGKIFVTSSLLAHLPFPYLGSYGSSKASLSYCIKTLQMELSLKKKDISVTLVEPGAFHTGFNQVMLDNQEKNQETVTPIDKKVYQFEHLLFIGMETFSYHSFVHQLVKEIEKKHPRKRIQMPKRQSFFIKIYQLFSL